MRASVTVIVIASMAGCGSRREVVVTNPEVVVLGESTRWRVGDQLPIASPWFDGTQVSLLAARGETLGLQVFHARGGAVTLTFANAGGLDVHAFAVEQHVVKEPSSSMYGGSLGSGRYPDGLVPATAPTTDPAFIEIAVARDAAPGTRTGELVVGTRRFAVALTIAKVVLPPPRLDVWAYFDQRELAWQRGGRDEPARPFARPAEAGERACIDMFRAHGILLSPDMPVEAFAARRALLFDFPYVPAIIPDDPARAGDAVRAWIEATAGTGKVPFAIPIDEPRTPEARARVRALADAARAAGGGPGKFLFAVTDGPHPEYGDAIDLYISWTAAHLTGDSRERWTYNGKPPRAGSMVLDTRTPGTRTWGWIAHRWNIPVWYVWDALYWHDRHNRAGRPLPGRALDAGDSATFRSSDGEDIGNFDGVLALPAPTGCRRTLRLAALRRGFTDRALLELAATCDRAAADRVAARLVPRALADAPKEGEPAWPTDEAPWELARRQLIAIAMRCAP